MLHQYAERPRKTFISPRTKESAFALYTVAWRKVVEDVGSLKFPKDAAGKAIYGSVMLSIEIDRKGQLVDTAVERSSGNKQARRSRAAHRAHGLTVQTATARKRRATRTSW